MSSGLTKEHYIVIPASLAQTIGLEEAVMMQIIGDLQRYSTSSHNTLTISQQQLAHLCPFWNDLHLRNILNSLQAKGIIEANYSGNNIVIAPAAAPPSRIEPIRKARSTNQKASAIGAMAADWQPRHATYQELMQSHGIPQSFASEQLTEFRLYWRDRQTTAFSWDSKFVRHVLHAWKNQQPAPTEVATFNAEPATSQPLTSQWQPSEDAVEILSRSGIPTDFILSAVPEFILYWRERGDSLKTWNSKFVGHIRRQWGRVQSAIEHNTEPHRIAKNWQPSADLFDILSMANIDHNFARAEVPSFVLYWRETNQLHNSWNSKFLAHVKYQWAKQHQLSNENTNQSSSRPDSRSFVEKHTDTSWADEL